MSGLYSELSNLISKRLLGVKREDQNVELEDADWRLIIDALSHKALVLAEQNGEIAQILVPSAFIDFVKNAPVSSGVCCCGDNILTHGDPMSCGHTPVDQWHWSLSLWIKQIAKAEAETL